MHRLLPQQALRAGALEAYLGGCAAQDFEWGHSDCVNFAAGWLAVARPDLPPLDFFQRANALQAARQIRRVAGGAGGLGAAVRRMLGDPIAPLLAGIGDFVLLPTLREQARKASGRPAGALGYTLGICAGGEIAAPALRGLIYTPAAIREPGRLEYLSAGVAAWRV